MMNNSFNPDAVRLIQEEIALAGVTPEEEQRLKALEGRRIRPDTPLPEVEFLFRLHGKPCFARGELVGLSGKAKSGKTFVCSILMALGFRNQVLSVERIEPRRLHVLWYDTEQSEESTQDILRNRVIPLTGIPEDQFPMAQFDIFNVRGEAWSDRRNLRGWIGTELKNKAFEVYECVKSCERIFIWSQTDTRKYDIPESLSFAVNDKGLPYRCTSEQLIDAQMAAQRKMADKMQQGSTLPDLNPKYTHKEGRKHVFDTKLLFQDIMQPSQVFSEDDLKREIYAKTNDVKDKLLSNVNPLGKKEYVLSPR